ncbi:MAG: hypothetical protein FJ030_08120 [Chloroflexi bacterium]|nr:hypothetical protein [Chloroflexota bacterium]
MNDDTVPVGRRRARDASIPIWALAFVAMLFVVTCLSLWAYIAVSRPTVPLATSSAVFIVITPITSPEAPTLDPLLATLTAAPPTATVPPNVNPGFINLGSFVQVVRTDGDPLKLRQAPSLTAEVNYLALPNEVLKVENGPTIADGFTWWFLVDLTNDTRNGWAVENYLQATTAP